jgi:non-heme chloroperoxidase
MLASSTKEPAMPTITTRDGTQLFCRSWGDGPAVVFCHGWAMNGDVWQPMMYRLVQAGFRAIAYDRRGQGRSDDPGRGYDYDTLADDLDSVLAACRVENATLVGHSMGNGEIVRRISRHGAHGIGRIVMLAPSLPYGLKTSDNPQGSIDGAQAAAMRETWVTGFPEWLAPAVARAFAADVAPERLALTIRNMLQTSLQAAIETNIAVAETDFRAELATLAVPTLILHGDADVSAPLDSTGRRVADLVPGARLKVYPGAQHSIVLTHVDDIVSEIVGFAREVRELAA